MDPKTKPLRGKSYDWEDGDKTKQVALFPGKDSALLIISSMDSSNNMTTHRVGMSVEAMQRVWLLISEHFIENNIDFSVDDSDE